MRFKDRNEAARLLANELSRFRGQHPLVLGVPRGAVPMARLIADKLEGDVDVVLVHKLRAPRQPELAIGAIDETGHGHLSAYAQGLASAADVDAEKRVQTAELQRRRRLYSGAHPPIDPAGRVVIVVDDGIATGASMRAALRCIRARKPARLILAAPVAPPATLQALAGEADEIVCLSTPEYFDAVGAFYADFASVSDEDVVAALAGRRPSPYAAPAARRDSETAGRTAP